LKPLLKNTLIGQRDQIAEGRLCQRTVAIFWIILLPVREERSAIPVLNRLGRDMGQQVGGPARILDLVAAVGQLDDPPVITVATKTFYAVGAP